MKNIIIANKLVSLIIVFSLLIYAFTGYEITPNNGYIYYPQLMGFFNSQGTVTEGSFAVAMMVLVIIIVGSTARCISIFTTDIKRTKLAAGCTSYNVSNILEVIHGYIFIQFALSIYPSEGATSVISTISCIALFIAFFFMKVSEVTSSTDREEDGAFGLRKSLNKYFNDKELYDNHKEQLIRNYKKLTT